MDTQLSMDELLDASRVADTFQPYVELSEAADVLTVYFKNKPDFSKRLTDHVTLYLSLEDESELVGCRIKGVSGIIEDLPNYVHVTNPVSLSVIFLAFRGGASDDLRDRFNDLAQQARDLTFDVSVPG